MTAEARPSTLQAGGRWFETSTPTSKIRHLRDCRISPDRPVPVLVPVTVVLSVQPQIIREDRPICVSRGTRDRPAASDLESRGLRGVLSLSRFRWCRDRCESRRTDRHSNADGFPQIAQLSYWIFGVSNRHKRFQGIDRGGTASAVLTWFP
jgi:hypothetical protein